jgi:dolichol kinase
VPPEPVALTLRKEIARKALHLVLVVVPLAYARGLPRRTLLLALGALLAIAFVVEITRARSMWGRALFMKTVGPLLREHERASWSGATWLFASLFLVVLLLPRQVAIAATWAVTVGDAAAAVVGRGWSTWRRRGGMGRVGEGKTVAGSLACLTAAFAGAVGVSHLSLGASLTGAAAAALAERPAGPGDDNIRVAVGMVAGILLWRMMFS